ncbi:TetR/AcrR family transcriptional regulator [Caulobacter soli]|uniref:TetR/AcrR family transcriptional regulator n=1 Tax=Caulobacter soli TaxID=2708539 RepID=UPI0013EA7C50|nr:TetR/AcrR family transcriptional regulator [Caulobacter soli]
MAKTRSTNLNPAQMARRIEIGEERRARTRDKLLEAAYALFAVHGAEAPTIDDVIAKAGVARGTFYNHFETRDDLFRAVANDIATAINTLILEAERQIRDPVVRIAIAFRMFVDFATADPARGWILLRTMPLVGSLNGEMSSKIRLQFQEALSTGRLKVQSLNTAIDIGLGLQVMTIRRILTDGDEERAILDAVQALLIALGLDAEDAAKMAALPIAAAHLSAPGRRGVAA